MFGLREVPSVEASIVTFGGALAARVCSTAAVAGSFGDIRRRVEDGTAKDERQAIDQLEQLPGVR